MFQNNRTAEPQQSDSHSGPAKKRPQHSIIGTDLKITGDIESSGDITVHGTVEGSIKCRTLTLGEQPVVNSKISAETVRICGEFNGKVTAQKVVLTSRAKVSGDLEQASLEIEPGAVLEGTIRRLEPAKANGKAGGG